jgi:predicted porin
VALSGGFGKIALGQYDTPLFIAGLSYNPFGSSMFFSPTMRHYYGLGQGLPFARALTTDTGWVNSVTYETPDMGGFMATLQWSPKESAAPGDKDSFSIGASYNAGPLSLMAAYADHGLFSTAVAPATSAYVGKQKVYSLNGSYDFGIAKAFLQYTDVDNDTTFVTYDDTMYQVGVSVPVSSAGKVLASYGVLDRDLVAGTDPKSKIFSIGYDHALSKRTGLYAAYSKESFTGLKSGDTFAVGVKHSF